MSYSKAYERIIWVNRQVAESTALGATNLNKIDYALNVLDDRSIELEALKLDKATALSMVQDISWDESTGTITITYLNGKTVKIDTKLEKLAVNFAFDEETQKLVITLDDGTKQEVDLSSFITQYEFLDSDTVAFNLDGSKVTAIVKEGSIEEKHLRPDYLAEIKVESANALASAEASEASALKAKSYEASSAENAESAKEYMSKAEAIVGFDGATANENIALNKQTLGYGKKNLLKNTGTTKSNNGIKFTVNSDGSVTANGTVTATPAAIEVNRDLELEKGKSYILSGVPNNSNCFVKFSTTIDGNAGATYKEASSTRDCLFTYDGTKINAVSVLVRNVGTTIDNLTFYPMIRSADIEDGTYEPYVDDVDTRLDKIDNSILNTLEEIEANTDPDMIASALAVKELYNLVKNK